MLIFIHLFIHLIITVCEVKGPKDGVFVEMH